jgi:hypothetical protein
MGQCSGMFPDDELGGRLVGEFEDALLAASGIARDVTG